MKRALLLVALLAPSTSCVFSWVDGELQKASAKVDAVAEGEGEGHGGEGEGEGAGEGEGEGEGAVDPACEDDERLVLVTSDPENPLAIYRLTPGSLVPITPTGFSSGDGALVNETGDPAANVEGAVFDKADGLFFLVDATRFYAVDAHTLLQTNARAPEKAVAAGSFPSFHGVTATDRFVIGAGNGLLGMDRTGAVASGAVTLESSGSFHGAIAFVNDNTTYVAANSEFGYEVLATSDPNGQPTSSTSSNDDTRFADFGGAQARRGLGFDGSSGSLLLGNQDTVIIPKASNGFSLPPTTDDFVLPHGSFVNALAGRAGKGYVATEGSGDVFAIDLSTTPPTTIGAAHWDTQATSGNTQQLVVGCKRVILAVGGGGGPTLFNFDRDTLAAFGGGPQVHNIIDAILVDKADLALVGDP